jgi:hypothetical protein
MGWETRGGAGPYYYRKVRRGGRVVSEYVGRGDMATLFALLDEQAREQKAAEAEIRREEQREEAEADARLDALVREAEAVAADRLIGLGYHRHKRQWRRRRGGRKD